MSSINFKGKSAVWNYHLSVPYHTLEKDNKMSIKGGYDEKNLIIEGDNLLALKALLPKYQGKIQCIYIDPPYNTGKENWTYNDNVNSPLIQEWLKQGPVGLDDLTRHDKWLCMMVPRLKLLYELLDMNGVMFISIDDNEFANLKQLLNDLFGDGKTDVIVWKKSGDGRDGKMKNTTSFRKDHEYILVFYKGEQILNKIKELPNFQNDYDNPDNDLRGPYKAGSISNKEEASDKNHENYYTVISPSGKKFTREFNVSKEEFKALDDDKRIYWGKNGDAVPAHKIFINEERSITPYSVFLNKGTTTEGKKELREMFGITDNEDIFDNPKPVLLIKTLIQLASKSDSIILDSFAGSGTTAQAVIEQNKRDKGTRKYILIQIPEKIQNDRIAYKLGFRWIHEIMQERIKKIIKNKKVEGGFIYYKLGASIDADSILSGKLPKYEEFAKYVYYLATGKNHPDEKKIKEKDFFAGKSGNESVYLMYKQNMNELKNLSITLDWAQKVNEKDSNKKIVYAPACFLDDEHLEKFNIKFVSVPYNLFERK